MIFSSQRFFSSLRIVVVAALMVACAKGTSNTESEENTPLINAGDGFSLTNEKGETTRFTETRYSATDPTPTAYASAKVDQVPKYYWSNSGDERLIEYPAPTLRIELAADFILYSGGYRKIMRFYVPGVTPGTYYVDDKFNYEFTDNSDTEEYIGTYYLEKIVLSQVGNVGEEVRGAYYFWICNATCKYQTGEFIATRETDIEFKSQGNAASPVYLGKSPYVHKQDLAVKTGEASYYRLALEPGAQYNLYLDSQVSALKMDVYSESTYSNLICENDDYCEFESGAGEFIYVKAYLTIGKNFKRDYGLESIAGEGFRLIFERNDFSTTESNAIDLGNAPFYRKSGYVSDNHPAYYKATIEPDKFYTIANFGVPNVRWGFESTLTSYTQFANKGNCQNQLYSESQCTFLSGAEQTTLVLQLDAWRNSPVLFSLHEAVFASVGKLDKPVEISQFNYRQEGYVGLATYRSEVGSDSSFYKVAVSPRQAYRADLMEVFDDLSISVYSDANFSNVLCSADAKRGTNGQCLFNTPEGAQSVFVRVDGNKAATFHGSPFVLALNPIFASQGTKEVPVDISNAFGSAYQAQVAGGDAAQSFYKINVSPNTAVQISLDELRNEYRLSGYLTVYSDAAMQRQECGVGSEGDICNIYVGAEGMTLYLVFEGSAYQTGSNANITVTNRQYKSNGTVASPVDIGMAPVKNYSNESGVGESYFRARVGKSLQYRASLVLAQDNLNLHVYGDSGFTQLLCESTNTEKMSDYCDFASPSTGFVFVKISGEAATLYHGSDFSLNLTQLFANAGTSAVPQGLGTSPLLRANGTVGPTGNSYYSATVVAGKEYQIRVYGATENGSISVFSGQSLETKSIGCTVYLSYGQGLCRTSVTTGTNLWLDVTGPGNELLGGARFNIAIQEAGVNEGAIGAPMDLGTDFPLQRSSTVGKAGASYYALTVVPNSNYVMDVTDGLPLFVEVYTDINYTTRHTCTTTGISNENYCQLQTNSTERILYIKVRDSNTSANATGAAYTLNVYNTLPVVAGTMAEPVALPAAPIYAQRAQYSTGYQPSYYSVPVKGATAYTIYFSNINYAMRAPVLTSTTVRGTRGESCQVRYRQDSMLCTFVTDPADTNLYIQLATDYYWAPSFVYIDVFEN